MLRFFVVNVVILLLLPHVHSRRSVNCPGGCIIASVLAPERQCTCVVPQCSWEKAFGLENTRIRRINGKVLEPKAAHVAALDCDFCESGALTYDTFAECYQAQDDFVPKGPSIKPSSYPLLIEGRREAVMAAALVPLDDILPPRLSASAAANNTTTIDPYANSTGTANSTSTSNSTSTVNSTGAFNIISTADDPAVNTTGTVNSTTTVNSNSTAADPPLANSTGAANNTVTGAVNNTVADVVPALVFETAASAQQQAAATVSATTEVLSGPESTGSRRLRGFAGPAARSRRLLQTCPPANPCLDTSSMLRWENLFGTTTNTSTITIPTGTPVVLHGCAQPGSTVNVRSIMVPAGATLVIGDSPLNLNLQKINISGTFQMGTPSCPIQSDINVVVPGNTLDSGVFAMQPAVFDVHGAFSGLSWTRIASTVLVGARSIPLTQPVQWQPGNKIVLATTTWKDELVNQNEVLTVQSVTDNGFTVNTVEALKYNHYGKEYKAEVGLLTRRILFSSDATSTSSGIGPQTLLMTPNARITGAGYERWGARNIAGHYSIHFHLANETTNAYVKNCAIYNSNWRCITIHGTNGVTLQGNVGFNVHGHCYYLEDGVEERNVLDSNLAVFVHPIFTAGSGGGQGGTDRWQNASLFDPSDSAASGFYSLNCYNTWINNAASGGFAGFTFPNAPRPIKNHRGLKKANGFPFDPSQRPFILFKNNSAHSTGYNWEHASGIYFGGMIFYKTDPADNVTKLFYNNGRGSIMSDPLCPDPDWPQSDAKNNNSDCMVNSARDTRNVLDNSKAFIVIEDCTVSLSNVGVMAWGERMEILGFQGYDITKGMQFLGQGYMRDALLRINTENSVNGWSGWPFSGTAYSSSWPVKGIQWYDTMVSTILSNVTFENYKYRQYTTNKASYWYYNTPHAFRMISFSDQFKPDKTMVATKGIKCNNCDFGTCTNGNSNCTGGAFYRVDERYSGSSWFFNWLDHDGSVTRHVAPAKPAGRYLITSQPDWWKLDNVASWKEPRFGGEYNPVWVNPMPANEMAARIEMRVQAENGSRYTVSMSDGVNAQRMGYVSQFGDVSKQVVLTRTEGTVGMTGPYGWYTVFNTTSNSTYTAPKRLELILFNLPREKWVYWTSCWPAGTNFNVSKTFAYASCQNVNALGQVGSRDDLLRSGGDKFFVDANNCLHLKLTDPGTTSRYTGNFTREDISIEQSVRWYDLKYTITTNMTCSDTFFCPLQGDPTSRVPAAITSQPPSCGDVQPSGALCGSVKCGWSMKPGCTNPTINNGGFCQASCGTCLGPLIVPSPSPKPAPSPSPRPSPSPSPKPSPSPSPKPSPSPSPKPSPSPSPRPSPSPSPKPSPSPSPKPSPSPSPKPSPSPSPKPSPSPSPKPSPSPSPRPSPLPSPSPLSAPLATFNLTISMIRRSVTGGITCSAQVIATTQAGTRLGDVSVRSTWGSLAAATGFPYNATRTSNATGVAVFDSSTLLSTPGGCTFTVREVVRTGFSLVSSAARYAELRWP